MPHLASLAHPSEEMLEEYALERLSGEEAAPVEEHLLFCSLCQDRLAAADEYILLMKTAARELQSAPAVEFASSMFGRRSLWAGLAAAGLAAGTVFWMVPRRPAGRPERVDLLAYRGADEIAHARAGRRVNLSIDVSDVAPSATYRLQVVDASGREEWTGRAAASGSMLSVEVSKPLSRGIHWVRLSSDRGELLREFGLRIE